MMLSVLSVIVAVGSIIIYFLNSRLGFGIDFPYQAAFREKIAISTNVDIIIELPSPPGNLGVSKDGRVIFTFHPEYKDFHTKLAEVVNKTSFKPFPNANFQTKVKSCLSLRIDSENRLWALDFADHGFRGKPTLYSWELAAKDSDKSDNLVVEYEFPSNVAGMGSMLNDFQISSDCKAIYIADTSILGGTPAIVVYLIESSTSYRLLQSHSSMYGYSSFLNIDNVRMKIGPFGVRINVDSIALSRDGAVLYYSPFTSDKLYCVETRHLMEAVAQSITPTGTATHFLHRHVHTVLHDKPASDGLSTDLYGNVYITAVEHSAIAIASPVDGPHSSGITIGKSRCDSQSKMKLHKGVASESIMRWPDGLSFGPGRYCRYGSSGYCKCVE